VKDVSIHYNSTAVTTEAILKASKVVCWFKSSVHIQNSQHFISVVIFINLVLVTWNSKLHHCNH